ncbi:MAG TPA: HAMP domain-containing sensor histidine kinase [Chloroflexota bacterium]|nr:HAMP domain-containing sensor histidine kinase [Chloroflexota bacterium]
MQKIRFLFLVLTLLSLAGTWERLRETATADSRLLPAALAALPLLGLWWIWCFRQQRSPVWALPLEGVLLGLACVGAGGPVMLFGLLYLSLGFRSLYGDGVTGLLPTVVWALVIAAAFAITRSFSMDVTGIGALQTPGILVNGFIMWLLGSSLRQRELWFDRERGLLEQRELEAEDKAKALADLNVLKDRLIERVSHEVRTPLSAIRSYSEMLLEYHDPEVQDEFLSIIHSESQRLSRLVEDVLDLAKIESGTVSWHMAELDVRDLVREAERSYRPLIEKRGLQFGLEVPPSLPRILGDRDRLMQVLNNLLGNAIKFTPAGEVRLAAQHREGSVELSVADSGIGVPDEERERIFERFHQAGAAIDGHQQGAGLGLAICREIAEHHGGRIRVDRRPGGGSVFTLALPAA